MGFIDFLKKLYNDTERMLASEYQQRVREERLEMADRRADEAERAFDEGRISFEQYSEVIASTAKELESYLNYQKFLENYEKKHNGQ